jgi:Trk K+ transport system NAD-binding subunit
MRAPLIVLIVIFSVSVTGLTLIPGQPVDGQPTRMTFFDSFYVMSYTATTIGYGEIPNDFSYPQRMWVTFCIYLTVIGWAYAIGTLLALGQDPAFRGSIALQKFRRRVSRLREPFLVIAGYGQAGRSLGRALDAQGARFVVLDRDPERIAGLELDAYYADVPGLAADARTAATLGLAGLGRQRCQGVLALTDSDESNLAIVIAAKLLRPDVTVIARAGDPAITRRMADFHPDAVIDPEGRFGEHLALSLLQPASYQLMTWLMGPPGNPLPLRPPARGAGRWVVYAAGHFADELSEDLAAVGLDVTVVDPSEGLRAHQRRAGGESADPELMALTDVRQAVGLVAGSDNDTTNLSLIAAARAVNPELYVAARQNSRATAPLLAALGVDAVLVPTQMVANEALARLVSPLMWQFLEEIPRHDNPWAARLVAQLSREGRARPTIATMSIEAESTPAIAARLADGLAVRIADLVRDPERRDHPGPATALLLVRREPDGPGAQGAEQIICWPDPQTQLAAGDHLLMAGPSWAHDVMLAVATDPVSCQYACTGHAPPKTWVGRTLARRGGPR